jgi:phospholipid transport system substrate-binding protein
MAFIDGFGNRAISVLTVDGLSDKELADRFRELFKESFDVPVIGRRVLGRYWPRATDAERAEYLDLFEDYVVQIYALRFRAYSGEGFAARDTRPGTADYLVVNSEVISPGSSAPPVKVDWLVLDAGTSYKIEDVIIEGVSMVATQREEFSSVIRQRGGKVAGLIEALRKKTQNFAAQN